MAAQHPNVLIIQQRLTAAFAPTHLQVIDESDQHIGHAGHQGGGRHFAIIIAAAHFNSLSRVAAHRAIYALFADLMPQQIHALKIKIL
jgi:BolA protein